MPIVLCVEGYDCTGKTTLIDALVNELNSEGYVVTVLTTITSEINDRDITPYPDISNLLYKVVSTTPSSSIHNQLLVLGSHHYTLYKIKNILDTTDNTVVILDRSILSFMVYQHTRDDVINEVLNNTTIPLYESLIDITILLHPSKSTVINRLKNKKLDKLESTDMDVVTNYMDRYLNHFKQLKTQKVLLTDSTHMELSKLYDKIHSVLEDRINERKE